MLIAPVDVIMTSRTYNHCHHHTEVFTVTSGSLDGDGEQKSYFVNKAPTGMIIMS